MLYIVDLPHYVRYSKYSIQFKFVYTEYRQFFYFSATMTRDFLFADGWLAHGQKCQNHNKLNEINTFCTHSPWHPSIIVSPMRTFAFFNSFVKIGGGAVFVALKKRVQKSVIREHMSREIYNATRFTYQLALVNPLYCHVPPRAVLNSNMIYPHN